MREPKRFDDLPLMDDDQLPAMRDNDRDDVLAFELSPDEVRRAVGVDLAHERHLALGEGQLKMTLFVQEFIQVEPFRHVPDRSPSFCPEHPWESRAMVFAAERTMRFLEVVIVQESSAGVAQLRQGGTGVPSEDAILPEAVEALHGGISSRLPRWDEYQVDAQEQVEPDDVGDAMAVSAATGGRHLIVQLRHPRNAHPAPTGGQVPAQREGALVAVLADRRAVPRHVQSVEGVEPDRSPWSPEISWSHQIGLVEVSHSGGRGIGIGLPPAHFSPLAAFLRRAVTGKDAPDRREGGNAPTTPLGELPLDGLGADAGKGSPAGAVRLQLFPDGKHSSHQGFGRLSPDSFRSPASILQALDSLFSISPKPLRQPSLAPAHLPEDLDESSACFIQLDCFVAYVIFILALHRLVLLRIYRRIPKR